MKKDFLLAGQIKAASRPTHETSPHISGSTKNNTMYLELFC